MFAATRLRGSSATLFPARASRVDKSHILSVIELAQVSSQKAGELRQTSLTELKSPTNVPVTDASFSVVDGSLTGERSMSVRHLCLFVCVCVRNDLR